jgi:hypothetical protein
MRVSIPGRLSPDQLLMQVTFLAESMRRLGIDALEGVNFYFHPLTEGKLVGLVANGGERVDHIIINGLTAHGYFRTRLDQLEVETVSTAHRTGARPAASGRIAPKKNSRK